jgi:hypothetical protein
MIAAFVGFASAIQQKAEAGLQSSDPQGCRTALVANGVAPVAAVYALTDVPTKIELIQSSVAGGTFKIEVVIPRTLFQAIATEDFERNGSSPQRRHPINITWDQYGDLPAVVLTGPDGQSYLVAVAKYRFHIQTFLGVPNETHYTQRSAAVLVAFRLNLEGQSAELVAFHNAGVSTHGEGSFEFSTSGRGIFTTRDGTLARAHASRTQIELTNDGVSFLDVTFAETNRR